MIEYKKNLSDIGIHNPENFVYIAYAFMDLMYDPLTPEGIESKVRSITDSDNFFRASLVGRVTGEDEKQKIVNKYGPKIANTSTLGYYGFIVTPSDDESIYIAWNCDLGSPNDVDELRSFAFANKGKRRSVFHLLTDNVRDPHIDYNELILRGNPTTKISAVFYQEDGGSNVFDKATILIALAQNLLGYELPLIKLPARDASRYDPIFVAKGDREPAGFHFLATDAQLSVYREKFVGNGSSMASHAAAPLSLKCLKITLPGFRKNRE